MFTQTQLKGDRLPAKTLCLTFDDGPGVTAGNGPGPKTLRLAEYLHGENIKATFFVLGRHAIEFPEIVKRLVELGHIVGNHTVNHPNFSGLPSYREAAKEIVAAHNEVVKFNASQKLYFRAPYGSWPDGYADALNQHLDIARYYAGPIDWDVNMNDWDFWGKLSSAEACAEAYLAEIIKVGKGIIVMHDCTAEQDELGLLRKNNNKTFEAIKIMVPALKGLGYKFASLDEINF